MAEVGSWDFKVYDFNAKHLGKIAKEILEEDEKVIPSDVFSRDIARLDFTTRLKNEVIDDDTLNMLVNCMTIAIVLLIIDPKNWAGVCSNFIDMVFEKVKEVTQW